MITTNKLTIIGNLVRDPESHTTKDGKTVVTITVAVNRKRKVEGQPEADFFRVSVWNQMGEACAKYLSKGKKVCVIGSVSVRTYQTQSGETRASMEVMAQEVEFLGGGNNAQNETAQEETVPTEQQGGFTAVETDELPF